MVKATCDRCGALYELDDASVPPSGKVMKCLGCGNAITVMPGGARAGGKPPPLPRAKTPPPIPKMTQAGLGGAKKPAAPLKGTAAGLGPPGAFVGGGTDLADLPAPKRKSALAGADPAAKNAGNQRSSLLEQAGVADLPAPVLGGGSRKDIIDLPAPVGSGGGDVSGLPAPVGVGKPGRDLSDLPAPVSTSPSALGGLPASMDLPAPVGPSGGGADYSDLLAPVDRSSGPTDDDLLAPVGLSSGADLLAPKGPSLDGGADLLAPKGPSLDGGAGLLAPKGPAFGGGEDLLAPKGPAFGGGEDLLAPKGMSIGGGPDDLLAPKGPGGLTDPFADLPAPKGAQSNLPAPKYAGTQAMGGRGIDNLPAPKAGGGGVDLPAPKGFFDDIPAPGDLGGEHSVPAPKGFFDDIPAPVGGDHSDLLAPKGGSGSIPLDLGSPVAGNHAKSQTLAAGLQGPSGSLDLDDLDLAPPSSAGMSVPALDLGSPGAAPGPDAKAPAFDLGGPGAGPLDLDGGHNESAAMPLELGAPTPEAGGTNFGDVDLPTASSMVSFSTDAPAAPTRPAAAKLDFGSGAAGGSLELDAEPMAKKATVAADLGPEDLDAKPSGKKKKKATKKAKAEKQKFQFTRTHAMIGIGILVLGIAGAGGFIFYQKQQEKAKKAKEIDKLLDRATRQMIVDDANHWQAAETTATRALRMDKGNTRAMGIAAQARYAAYLDRGTANDIARLGLAKKLITKLEDKNARGDDVARADAIKALTDEPANPTYALKKLAPQATKRGEKGALHLYLGWAHAAAGNHANAIAAFQKSIQQNRNKTSATYWMGRSHLAEGNAKAAREAFNKVRERDKNHIGALLGTYQLDSLSLDDRMKRYDGLLKRKDIKDADMRVRSLANSLIGDLKLESGGIEEAKRRYDAALKLDGRNLNAKIGKAKAAFKLNRLDEARRALGSLLKGHPNHIEGTFVLASVSIAEGKVEEAQTQIDKVLKRTPPIQNAAIMLRAQMIQGAVHEAAAKAEKNPQRVARLKDSAIASYTAAKKLVGASGNIQPNVALTIVLTSHPDAAKRALAEQELAPIKKKAEQTPSVAAKLGLAFLNAKQPTQAETWFRTALRQTDNIETRFQLGVALKNQRKFAEAIRQIDAAFSKNENREDIGLELAILYETLAQHSRAKHDVTSATDVERKAQALYQRLLRATKPSLNVRARAGRFYARLAHLDVEQRDPEQLKRSKALRHEAEKQGQIIVAEKRDHAAGQFLLGEGSYARGDFDRAKALYQKAVHTDADPQYLEGLARAYEHLTPPAYDKARQNYVEATKTAPNYLPPRYGVIRVRMKNQSFALALQELELLDKLRPRDAWVWRKMGESYLALQKFPKAIAAFSLAVAYGDRDPLTSYRLGRAYFDDDRVGESTRALERATALIEVKRKEAHARGSSYSEPKWTVEVYKLLGHAHRIRGNKRQAVKAWRQYLQRNPGNQAEVRDIKKLLKRLGAY